MNKSTTWSCGNVSVTAELLLPDGTPNYVADLAVDGLTQQLQRTPSGAWEVGEVGDDWEKNEKGTPIRPKGFKRNSIPYSVESADRLVEQFDEALGDTVGYVKFTTKEHTGGETNSRKNAESFIGKLGEDTVRELLTNLGMKCDSYEELIEAAHKQFFGKK